MQFTKIDINNWTRKEYFDHYFDNTPCTLHTAVSSGSWCGGQRQQCGDSGSGLR